MNEKINIDDVSIEKLESMAWRQGEIAHQAQINIDNIKQALAKKRQDEAKKQDDEAKKQDDDAKKQDDS